MVAADCTVAMVSMEDDEVSASRQIHTALAHAVFISNKMSKSRPAHDKTPGMQQYKRMTMFQINIYVPKLILSNI